MFSTKQIHTVTEFIRNHKRILDNMRYYPQNILLSSKSGEKYVLMNSEIYDELMELKFEEYQKISSLKTES